MRASLAKFKQFQFIKATVCSWFYVYFYLEQFLGLNCFPIRAGSLLPEDVSAATQKTSFKYRQRVTCSEKCVNVLQQSSALQRKSHLCIPFLGVAWPRSQFPHSCDCGERFKYSQDQSTYFLQQNRQIDHGDM